MDNSWNTVLWRQFGAAIDTLENALVACPDTLWRQRLWGNAPGYQVPAGSHPQFGELWYVAFHTLFWLDLYLAAAPEEEFAPPAPLTRPPERTFTKEELLAYLAATRRTCHATLSALTDEKARQAVPYPWIEGSGEAVSFLELQLYSMRHVQEHAAQLSLYLGQHAVPDEALDWVPRPKDEPTVR
jgi:uncharacterized damage-inducible protein DinB